jgi:hypothetical protein
MVSVNPRDWGVIGFSLPNSITEQILRCAGHNSIRCINKAGRTLANTWMKEGRDDRAKSVDGSAKNWTAYSTLYEMLRQEQPDQPAIYLQANRDVVFAMMRAAFGEHILGSTLNTRSANTTLSSRFELALVHNKGIILMKAITLEGSTTEVLHIQLFTQLNTTLKSVLKISRVIRSFPHMCQPLVVWDIMLILDLHYNTGRNYRTLSIDFNLPVNIILRDFGIRYPTGSINPDKQIVPGRMIKAYIQSIAGEMTHDFNAYDMPGCKDLFFATFRPGFREFCVVERGTYAFRGHDFPTDEDMYD